MSITFLGFFVGDSSASADNCMKIVLALISLQLFALRERPYMSKRSREVAESAVGAILRMGAW